MSELSYGPAMGPVGGPPSCVVERVSEPRRVYDGEPQFDSFLLDADCVFHDVDSLVDSF